MAWQKSQSWLCSHFQLLTLPKYFGVKKLFFLVVLAWSLGLSLAHISITQLSLVWTKTIWSQTIDEDTTPNHRNLWNMVGFVFVKNVTEQIFTLLSHRNRYLRQMGTILGKLLCYNLKLCCCQTVRIWVQNKKQHELQWSYPWCWNTALMSPFQQGEKWPLTTNVSFCFCLATSSLHVL